VEKQDDIEAALAAGATVVALNDADGSANAKTLYQAATALKTLVRSRAAVLACDRTDIATSAELDGVVLSADGVPTVVARKSLPETSLVVVSCVNAEDAQTASKEGADLLLVRDIDVLDAIRETVSVPIFVDSTVDEVSDKSTVSFLADKRANGVTLREGESLKDVASIKAGVALVLEALEQDDKVSVDSTGATGEMAAAPKKKFSLVSDAGEEMIERERRLIEDVLAFLQENCQDLEEIKLLIEARKGLEELFLLVIVGEFNAGKSSLINAMLGDKFVAEGILPTTNEISVLRYGNKKGREQTEDGFFNIEIPAELLQQVRIVDTPGTNVILQRQQRLTEEFVPRADLVLFVLSADRPMTESEVKFLTYIRKWGKKVVFVVNKTDLLESERDVDEVMKFVKENATRLLGVSDPAVLPVSSRNALKAKKRGGSYARDSEFISSRFGAFEDYVVSFLGGSGARAGEALQLKLSTPLNVSELLLNAAEEILEGEDDEAKSEVAIAAGVKTQMDNYKAEMIADAATQRAAAREVVSSAVKRAENIVDESLRLSNAASLFSTYILGSGSSGVMTQYKTNVLGDSEQQLKSAVQEFSAWLKRNNDAQIKAYTQAVEDRGFETSLVRLAAEWEDDEEVEASSKAAMSVATGFDHVAAAQMLDEAIRGAVNSTVGSAAGAFFIAFVATGYLNSLTEDVLVYALAAAGAYVSVLALPLKRSETKAKIRRVAETFLKELEETMEKQCTREVSQVAQSVATLVAPWEASARAEAARVDECITKRRSLAKSLDEIKRDVANL
jgi:small GTP-binding protein